jgi:hypothetical protein
VSFLFASKFVKLPLYKPLLFSSVVLKPVPSVDKLTQYLSTVVISFRIKVRETLPLKAAFIKECSGGEA